MLNQVNMQSSVIYKNNNFNISIMSIGKNRWCLCRRQIKKKHPLKVKKMKGNQNPRGLFEDVQGGSLCGLHISGLNHFEFSPPTSL